MSNLTPNLSECCVCQGNIWTQKHKYYIICDEELVKRGKKWDISYFYLRVYKIPYSWKGMWFLRWWIFDVKYIKICDRCFGACASNEKIIYLHRELFGDGTLYYSDWKATARKRYYKIRDGTRIDYFLEKLYKQDWRSVLKVFTRTFQVYKDITTLLSKVIDDTDKYRKIVQNAAKRSINKSKI